jgi:hypothetical protein
MARLTWSFIAVIAALLSCGTTSEALEGPTVTGLITATEPAGAPVAGAFVVLLDGDDRYAAITDATGAFTITGVDSGDYTLRAHATGYGLGEASVTVPSEGGALPTLALAPSGTVFETLGVFGGQIAALVADGRSGVFYASTSVIPQVFRTADYGGTWSPVTPAGDDPGVGLPGSNAGGGLTTSGFPGDVAVEVSGSVYFSTDFGTTWRAVAASGPLPGGPNAQLFWGHGGSTNVLLRVSGTSTLRADLAATTPTFADLSPSYVTSANDRVAVASVEDGAWVAVVDASGGLALYDIADATPGTPAGTIAGLPSPPTFVRLGGLPGSEGAPPDALLVYANTGNTAVLATKSGGTTFTSVSAATSVPMGCGAGPGSVGAIMPGSSGTTGGGTVAQCYVAKSGTDPLVFTTVPGINNNTGLAFDTFYSATNFVALSGDGNRGIVKSASQTSGVPTFPIGVDAAPGIDLGSGGVAVNGLTVPVVKDTSYGPAGAGEIATSLSGSGGGLSVASDDGGDTFTTVVAKGGNAVDWWQGSSTSWLVFGHGGAGTLVTAVADWTPGTPPLGGPNVPGLDASALGATGMAEQFTITAVRGVPGGDVVFIGGGSNVDQTGTGGTVFRGLLLGSGSIADGTVLSDPLIGPRAVRALAYCASIGDDEDVLFVATASDTTGTIVRVVAASGATPVVTEVYSGGRVNDVRVHCASGTAYAGTGSNSGGPSGGLLGSTDGGATFTPLPIAGPGLPPNLNVQVVAVDPSDAAHLLVAGNSEGYVLESTDAGATWTVVNSPSTPGGRNFLSEGVGDLEFPPATAALTRAAGPGSTLVGTGGGLFAASFGSAGGGGGGCTTDVQCDDGDACTTDVCASATCSHPQITGVEGARCELDVVGDGLSCADAKLQRLVAKKLTKIRRLLDKYAAATKPSKAQKLAAAMQKQLAALARKVSKAKKSDADCKALIGAQLDAVRDLIGGL